MNRTYLVRLADEGAAASDLVVRVIGQRERAAREAGALRLVDGTAVPAPRLVWRGRVRGLGWAVVSTRVPGRLTADPGDPRWLARLVEVLVAIHGVPPQGRSLPVDPGAGRAWLDEDPHKLGLGRLGEELLPALRSRREQLAVGPHVLTHGDFHPGNVHWLRGRVSGVIDWEMAHWAPAASDVAYLYMDFVLAAGRRVAERFLAAYERHAGPVPGFDARLLLACARPLPDPARWLPSWEAAGYTGLTPVTVRRRLRDLIRSQA